MNYTFTLLDSSMSIGDTVDIINNNYSLFKKIFTKKTFSKNKFGTKQILYLRLQRLNQEREVERNFSANRAEMPRWKKDSGLTKPKNTLCYTPFTAARTQALAMFGTGAGTITSLLRKGMWLPTSTTMALQDLA